LRSKQFRQETLGSKWPTMLKYPVRCLNLLFLELLDGLLITREYSSLKVLWVIFYLLGFHICNILYAPVFDASSNLSCPRVGCYQGVKGLIRQKWPTTIHQNVSILEIETRVRAKIELRTMPNMAPESQSQANGKGAQMVSTLVGS
jgi:hypothetical protein